MEYRRYRSLFWPVVLIGVGLIWLLSVMGVIPAVSLYSLVRLWPILLIVAGLDLLFGRRSPVAGTLIGLLAVVAVIAILIAGPMLGLSQGAQPRTEQFQAPLENAASARVVLDLESYPTTVRELSGSDMLLDATIVHHGEMRLSTSGTDRKEVQLASTGSIEPFPVLDFNPGARWDVALSPQIPIDLRVDGGSGSVDLQLGGLNLSALTADVASGSMDLNLPEAKTSYPVTLTGGSGSLDVRVPCTAVEIKTVGHSGRQSFEVPSGCPLRVEVKQGGSGSVHVPGSLARIQGRGGEDEGIWESTDYASAKDRILIVMENLGSGSFNVR